MEQEVQYQGSVGLLYNCTNYVINEEYFQNLHKMTVVISIVEKMRILQKNLYQFLKIEKGKDFYDKMTLERLTTKH